MFLSLVTCGRKTKDVDIRALFPELSTYVSMDRLKEEDALTLRSRYGLEPDIYADMIYYGPTTNMDAEEIVILRLFSPDDAEAV